MRFYKPNLYTLQPYEIDTTTTTDVIYKRYCDSTQNQYIERITLTDPVTSEWTFGAWADRASLTQYTGINSRYLITV